MEYGKKISIKELKVGDKFYMMYASEMVLFRVKTILEDGLFAYYSYPISIYISFFDHDYVYYAGHKKSLIELLKLK